MDNKKPDNKIENTNTTPSQIPSNISGVNQASENTKMQMDNEVSNTPFNNSFIDISDDSLMNNDTSATTNIVDNNNFLQPIANNMDHQTLNTAQPNNNINKEEQINNSKSINFQPQQNIEYTNQQQRNNNTTNDSDLDNKDTFKKEKIMMIIVLIISLIIFFDNFITSMNWFESLWIKAIISHDKQLELALENFKDLIIVTNWIMVFIITVLSIIFLIKDRKKKNTKIYGEYALAGVLHILIGTRGLTPIIYSISTLISALKNKKINKTNNSSIKTDNFIILFSSIVIILIIVTFVAIQMDLFHKVENYKTNKEAVIEDKDSNHTITTFDKIIDDWGNNITENKSYKIQNVKLNNTIATLYIDYTYDLYNNNPSSTIVFKHGDKELYKFTDKKANFNVSYISFYNNFILYGANYCDSTQNGICEKHPTYSQVLAFNKDDTITFYNHTILSNSDNYMLYNDVSSFIEDERIYKEPYNDFRVYDIKIKNNYINFYTIVEDYQNVYNKSKLGYDSCDNQFWITSTFDMQRVFKTNLQSKKLQKQSSITYYDYCKNKNILNISK